MPRADARRLVVLLALSVVLAACGRYYWSRPGGALEDFNRDSAACAKDASPQHGLVIEENYRTCLRARGWVRAPRLEAGDGWYRGIE